MQYKDLVVKNQRQAILQLLRDQNGYSINAAILQSTLGQLGMPISFHNLVGMLTWLMEAGYINMIDNGVMVSITRSRLDVVNGHAQHPDIERPLP